MRKYIKKFFNCMRKKITKQNFYFSKIFFSATKLGFFLFRNCSKMAHFHPLDKATWMSESFDWNFEVSFWFQNCLLDFMKEKEPSLTNITKFVKECVYKKCISNHQWHFQKKWNYFSLMIIKQNMKFNCTL